MVLLGTQPYVTSIGQDYEEYIKLALKLVAQNLAKPPDQVPNRCCLTTWWVVDNQVHWWVVEQHAAAADLPPSILPCKGTLNCG